MPQQFECSSPAPIIPPRPGCTIIMPNGVCATQHRMYDQAVQLYGYWSRIQQDCRVQRAADAAKAAAGAQAQPQAQSQAQALDEQHEQANSAIASLNAQHEGEVAQLKQDHQNEIAQLKTLHAGQLEVARAEAEYQGMIGGVEVGVGISILAALLVFAIRRFMSGRYRIRIERQQEKGTAAGS